MALSSSILTKIFAGLLVINLTIQFAAAGGDLMSKFKTCSKNDADCFKKSVQQAMKFVVKGSREYNIIPMDPLHIPKLEIGDLNGAANFLLKFENCDFLGMKGLEILSAKADRENYRYDIDLKLPYNVIQGPYEVNGRVLLLPIRGKGNINFTCDEPHLNWRIQFKKDSSSGKNCYKVDSFKLKTSKIITGSVYLTNLFDGDKTLGDGMNKFLNDNYQDVVGIVVPFFDEAMSALLEGLTRRIVDQLPCDIFF